MFSQFHVFCLPVFFFSILVLPLKNENQCVISSLFGT